MIRFRKTPPTAEAVAARVAKFSGLRVVVDGSSVSFACDPHHRFNLQTDPMSERLKDSSKHFPFCIHYAHDNFEPTLYWTTIIALETLCGHLSFDIPFKTYVKYCVPITEKILLNRVARQRMLNRIATPLGIVGLLLVFLYLAAAIPLLLWKWRKDRLHSLRERTDRSVKKHGLLTDDTATNA